MLLTVAGIGPGVLVVIIAFLVLAAVGHSEHESNLRCWSLLGMSAILLISGIGVIKEGVVCRLGAQGLLVYF